MDEALALGVDHVVQRRIVPHSESFALDEPGHPVQTFVVDNDPYTFRGRMGGLLVRLGRRRRHQRDRRSHLHPAFLLGPK